jgi:hypothetical protein
MFDEGYKALVCGDRYAFVRSPRFDTITESVIKISPMNFEKIQSCFDAEWKDKPSNA